MVRVLVLALLPALCASTKPSNWYYKGSDACTNSDSPGNRKCAPNAASWSCSGSGASGQIWCKDPDKQSCEDIALGVSEEAPDGFGFMCPSLMLGTSEMVAAAAADDYDGIYGVVTIDALKCGQCVEVVNEDEENFPLAPKLKAQVFNTVATSVDVYMAGGGLGANNGCAAVTGFKPLAAMYEKYPTAANKDFVKHLEKIGYDEAATQLDAVIKFGGGIRGGRTYADCLKKNNGSSVDCQPPGNGCDGGGGICITDPDLACKLAFKGKADFVTKKSLESCHFAFEHDLHWNRPITYQVVECPPALVKLTGLAPAGPPVTPGPKVKSSTTTMEDCCEPTCSRTMSVEGEWKTGLDAIYTCNLVGETYLEETSKVANPCTVSAATSGSGDTQSAVTQTGQQPLQQQQSMQQPMQQSMQQPMQQSMQQPLQQPMQQTMQQPMQQPMQQSMQPLQQQQQQQQQLQPGQTIQLQPGQMLQPGQQADQMQTNQRTVQLGQQTLQPGQLQPVQQALSGQQALQSGQAQQQPLQVAPQTQSQTIIEAVGQTTTQAQSSGGSCGAAYTQCGGKGWGGPTCCQSGCECTKNGDYYAQCTPGSGGGTCAGLVGQDEESSGPVVLAPAWLPREGMAFGAASCCLLVLVVAAVRRSQRPVRRTYAELTTPGSLAEEEVVCGEAA